jgi:hypothetical protein
MARARKKNTPKLREMSPTLASGAAEMDGAASAAFAGDEVVDASKRLAEILRGLDPLTVMVRKCFIEPVLRYGSEPQVITVPRPGPSLAEQFAKQLAEQKRLLSKTLKSVTQPKWRRRRRADPVEAEADVVRQGRPPYDRGPILAVAEELKPDPSRESQDTYVSRVRGMLELKNEMLEPQDRIPVPGDTVLTEICAPIYKREKSKK